MSQRWTDVALRPATSLTGNATHYLSGTPFRSLFHNKTLILSTASMARRDNPILELPLTLQQENAARYPINLILYPHPRQRRRKNL